jgi:hypothetical protein
VRRTPIVLAAVVALVPAIIWSVAAPAATATNSLTVTAIGRDGKTVATSVTATNETDGTNYTFMSGKTTTVSKGTYAVITDVYNTRDSTDTLGAKVLTVSGAATATIDARQGVPFNVSLDSSPGADYSEMFHANVCAADGIIFTYGWPGEYYIIPNTSKYLTFAYMATWMPSSLQGSDFYAVTGTTTGLPSNFTPVVKRSSLATVNILQRSGVVFGTDAYVTIQPHPADYNWACQSSLDYEVATNKLPYSVNGHLSAGPWTLNSQMYDTPTGTYGGMWSVAPTVVAGGSSSIIFGRATYGPSHNLPLIANGSVLYDAQQTFADPNSNNAGYFAYPNLSTSLSLNGKVLASTTSTSFQKKITTAGWYTLTSWGTQSQPSTLSTSASVSFYFYGNPKSAAMVAPVFLTRFLPLGIGWNNQATPNTTTNVQLVLDRTNQGPDLALHADTATSVQAWASFDGDKTWVSVHVTHSGSTWTAAVPNPASGFVSLRSKVTDAAGNSSTVTVNRAYAIG